MPKELSQNCLRTVTAFACLFKQMLHQPVFLGIIHGQSDTYFHHCSESVLIWFTV